MGRDCAGTIVGLGRGVNNNKYPLFKRDTKVVGQVSNIDAKMGTCAQYITMSVTNITKIPDNANISFVEAASFPLSGQVSYQALIDKAKLKKNDKVLILGGSSGCGILGIQIAKALGASEIAATSSQEEFCKSFGATKVYNYKKEKTDDKHCWYKDLKGMCW